MTNRPRVRKPEPGRDGPDRSSGVGGPAPVDPHGPVIGHGPAKPRETPLAGAIADSVKLAYDVIGQNIRQGREAADRFREGEYNVRDVPEDANLLALRMLSLTRELSATTFEIIERLLRDARLPSMGKRRGSGRRHDHGHSHGGHQDYRETDDAQEDGDDDQEDLRYGFYPVPPGHGPKTKPSPGVTLGCAFTGPRTAVLKSASLASQETPTLLGLTTLVSANGALPAITGVTFSGSADGKGIVANIPVPEEQPAGIYSGVVCSADTQAVLGSLTIEVLP